MQKVPVTDVCLILEIAALYFLICTISIYQHWTILAGIPALGQGQLPQLLLAPMTNVNISNSHFYNLCIHRNLLVCLFLRVLLFQEAWKWMVFGYHFQSENVEQYGMFLFEWLLPNFETFPECQQSDCRVQGTFEQSFLVHKPSLHRL